MLCISFLRLSGAQAELSKPSVTAAPLKRRKGNTQHLLVSTSDCSEERACILRKPYATPNINNVKFVSSNVVYFLRIICLSK